MEFEMESDVRCNVGQLLYYDYENGRLTTTPGGYPVGICTMKAATTVRYATNNLFPEIPTIPRMPVQEAKRKEFDLDEDRFGMLE